MRAVHDAYLRASPLPPGDARFIHTLALLFISPTHVPTRPTMRISRPRSAAVAAAMALALLAACTPGAVTAPSPRVSPDTFLMARYNQAIRQAAVWELSHVQHLNPAPDTATELVVGTFTSWAGYRAPSYPNSITLSQDVWVTLVPEVRDSCQGSADGAVLRLEQRLGLPPQSGDSLVVEMQVAARDVFRPAADPAITTPYPCGDSIISGCGEHFPDPVSPAHVYWIANWILQAWSIPGGYPWTRLGYTYNWGPTSVTHYGASEYVVRKNSQAMVLSVTPAGQYCSTR